MRYLPCSPARHPSPVPRNKLLELDPRPDRFLFIARLNTYQSLISAGQNKVVWPTAIASMQDPPVNEPNWGRYDFTSGSPTLWNQAAASRPFDAQAARDTLDYSNVRMSGCEDQFQHSTPVMYQTGPFTFSDLQERGFNESPSDRTTQSTSRRLSSSVPGEKRTGPSSLPLQSSHVCRLWAGQASHCTSELCGPDPACLEFSDLLDLEDCISVACDAEKFPNRPERTHSSHLPRKSIVPTSPSRPSTSQAKKESTKQNINSQQRLQRGKP